MLTSILVSAILLQAMAVAPAGGQQPSANSNPAPAGGSDNKKVLATIAQSRSTNTRGFRVTVFEDGSATVAFDSAGLGFRSEPTQPQSFSEKTVNTEKLRELLVRIGDVSRIPTGNCPKSVSFGTRTTISYAGKTSGDLQCLRAPGAAAGEPLPMDTAQSLKECVQAMVNELKINDHRMAR
jgi:hypothetical protein